MDLNLYQAIPIRTYYQNRETAHAAGYDLKVAERTVIAPGEIVLVPTGVKAICKRERCSISMTVPLTLVKRDWSLINSVGVIDGDYYGNPGNEGHIFAQMKKYHGPRSRP